MPAKGEPVAKEEGGNRGMAVDTKPSPSANAVTATSISSSSPSRANKASVSTRPKSPPPPTTFRDIPLLSLSNASSLFSLASSSSSIAPSSEREAEAKVKTHLLKLVATSALDLTSEDRFAPPLKLNRKHLPKLKAPKPEPGDIIKDKYGRPLLGLGDDGKNPVRWPRNQKELDQVKQWLNKGKEDTPHQADLSQIAPSSGGSQRTKSNLFKKRVREVHKATSSSRRTWNDERLPWVLEDEETSKEWESSRTINPSGLAALREEVEKFEKGQKSDVRFLSEQEQQAVGEGSNDINMSTSNEPGTSSIVDSKVKLEAQPEVETDMDSHDQATAETRATNHAPWLGKLEGDNGDANNHVLFVFDSTTEKGEFRCVPISKTYRFLQKSKSHLSAEEAEKEYERHQKTRDNGASRWMLRAQESITLGAAHASRLRNQPPRAAFSGVKKEDPGAEGQDDEELNSVPEWKHLLLPGGRGSGNGPMRVSRRRSFGQVDKGPTRRRGSEEGTYGEVDYEEEMADDDDRNEVEGFDMGDEETHELEERMKREMHRAEASEDEDEDGQEDLFGDAAAQPGRRKDDMLTGSGKQMKRIVKALARNTGNEAYEEESNPYLSDESDESDLAVANPEKALQEVREERERREREEKERQKALGANGSTAVSTPGRETPPPGSRSGNVTPSARGEKHKAVGAAPSSNATGMGQRNVHRPGAGHASVAQRATSPSASSANRQNKQSRASSRSTSPVGSAGTSGGAGGGTRPTSAMSRNPTTLTNATSASAAASFASASNKRKSEAPVSRSDMSIRAEDRGKRARTSTAGPGANASASRRSSPLGPSPNASRAVSPSSSGTAAAGSTAPSTTTTTTRKELNAIELDVVRTIRKNPELKDSKEVVRLFIKKMKGEQGDAYFNAINRLLVKDEVTGTYKVKDWVKE